MPEEKLKFVTVELSKKQVDMSHLYHSQNTDKDYARVMAPENGTFFYPTESIKVKKDNPERVYFTRPEGTEFVATEISEKLLRKFESKEGKPLYAVSVPVYEWAGEQATFYEIVVPAERVSINQETGRARLSLFKNGPDGNVYNHSATRSIDNGNGGYDTVSKTFSSEEIVSLFEDSKKKYRETHSAADRSLADETTESSDENENMEQAAASRRHLRR